MRGSRRADLNVGEQQRAEQRLRYKLGNGRGDKKGPGMAEKAQENEGEDAKNKVSSQCLNVRARRSDLPGCDINIAIDKRASHQLAPKLTCLEQRPRVDGPHTEGQRQVRARLKSNASCVRVFQKATRTTGAPTRQQGSTLHVRKFHTTCSLSLEGALSWRRNTSHLVGRVAPDRSKH